MGSHCLERERLYIVENYIKNYLVEQGWNMQLGYKQHFCLVKCTFSLFSLLVFLPDISVID